MDLGYPIGIVFTNKIKAEAYLREKRTVNVSSNTVQENCEFFLLDGELDCINYE